MTANEAHILLESFGVDDISFERADGFADGYDYAIESRTCESCIYWDLTKTKNLNVGLCLMGNYGIKNVPKYFGCNKWEEK